MIWSHSWVSRSGGSWRDPAYLARSLSPEQAFGNPSVLWRSAKVMLRGAKRNARYQLPDPPDREQTIASCEAAVA